MLVVGAISGLAAEPDVSAILARVQLLPVEDDAGLDSPAEYSPPADASPEERAKAALISAWREARVARFTKWVRHEDEFLSFLVPDDPRVRLEIKTPKDPVLIEGGQDLSKSISFFRCYRLTFRDETYCLLFLDRQSKFDDGGCFCGTVVYQKYLQHHDALYRFSLMRDGRIKKIQTLGEGLRLAGFEWTHMPISQEVYSQIALSVRWRQPPRDLRSLTAKIERTCGKSGFLEKGMDRSAVVALLGPPTSEDPTLLRYVFRRSHDEPPGSQIEEVTWNIPLKDGKFQGLSSDWCEERDLPPERNSVQWVLAKLEGGQGESDSVAPASKEELPSLLERVIELLPKARDLHWWMLCDAAVLLADRNVKDRRVAEIIKQRYLDPQLSATTASEALHVYKSEGSQELFAKRIRLEMSLARKPEAMKEQADMGLGCSTLKKLFGYLEPTFSQRSALIIEAMDHPHADIRAEGYSHWRDLPETVARAWLKKGLGDSSAHIRMDSAKALPSMRASEAERAEDMALLRAQLLKEKDTKVVEALNQAIKRLE